MAMKQIALGVLNCQHVAENSGNLIEMVMYFLLLVAFNCVFVAEICTFIELCRLYHANLHQDHNGDMYSPLLASNHKFVMGNLNNNTNTIEGNLFHL